MTPYGPAVTKHELRLSDAAAASMASVIDFLVIVIVYDWILLLKTNRVPADLLPLFLHFLGVSFHRFCLK